jgi:hypothetical protein
MATESVSGNTQRKGEWDCSITGSAYTSAYSGVPKMQPSEKRARRAKKGTEYRVLGMEGNVKRET